MGLGDRCTEGSEDVTRSLSGLSEGLGPFRQMGPVGGRTQERTLYAQQGSNGSRCHSGTPPRTAFMKTHIRAWSITAALQLCAPFCVLGEDTLASRTKQARTCVCQVDVSTDADNWYSVNQDSQQGDFCLFLWHLLGVTQSDLNVFAAYRCGCMVMHSFVLSKY